MKQLLLILKIIMNYKRSIIVFVFTCFIYTLVLLLYSVSIEIIGYSLILVLFFGFIILGYTIIKTYAKHIQLQNIINHEIFQMDLLPDTSYLIEKDYQTIIQKLYHDDMKHQSQSTSKYNDLQDITTLWAHQIKTPISAMRLLLQVSENKQNDAIKEELFEIEKYVEMLLGYYRLNAETNDFLIKEIDCEPIIRLVIRQYATFFIRKKIQIEVDNIKVKVLSDEKWLRFVIEQILSNALKYTNEGKIKISFEDEKTLVISDTGIGIQEEDIPRVFEKGYTGYNGRTDKKSTGLGLYLCKMILSKLGHSISLESKLNKGTVVKINLNTMNLYVE